MRSLKSTLFFLAMACAILSCKKGESDEGGDCEENNSTKVTYANTGTVPLRVVVATSLTSEFEPISPVVTLDLAPGASTSKEIEADQYFTVWYSNCSDECAMTTYYSKTYAQCGEYDEEHGF